MGIRTIHLDTAISNNCTKLTNASSKNTTFIFDTPPININKNTKLSVVGFIHKDSSGTKTKFTPTIKIKDISYNNETYWGNDFSPNPTILIYDTDYPSYFFSPTIMLNKQNINFITLVGTDSLSDINAGINTNIDFSIILQLEDV